MANLHVKILGINAVCDAFAAWKNKHTTPNAVRRASVKLLMEISVAMFAFAMGKSRTQRKRAIFHRIRCAVFALFLDETSDIHDIVTIVYGVSIISEAV